VVNYFLFSDYNIDFIDSVTYAKALKSLKEENLDPQEKRIKELTLLRNFLGGLTKPKIMELHKAIKIEEFEKEFGYPINKKEKLIQKSSMKEFKKRLERYKKNMTK